MKNILILTACMLFVSLNIFSQRDIVSKNITIAENGITVKEIVSVNPATKQEIKTLYFYSPEGKKIQRQFFVRKNGKWQNDMMHDYTYHDDGLVSQILLTRWNVKKQQWDTNKTAISIAYDQSGKLLSVVRSEIKSEELISQHLK